jgi:hypothetical protein
MHSAILWDPYYLLILQFSLRLPLHSYKIVANARWNQKYLDEELVLVNRLQDELYETNLIKKSNDKIEFEGNEILRTKPRTIYPYDYDFISYDFLNEILPQPELFELRQALAIPKEDIETT